MDAYTGLRNNRLQDAMRPSRLRAVKTQFDFTFQPSISTHLWIVRLIMRQPLRQLRLCAAPTSTKPTATKC